jgi:hypothetical protein
MLNSATQVSLPVGLPLCGFTGRHSYLANGTKQELVGEPRRERKPETRDFVIKVQDTHQDEHVNTLSRMTGCARPGLLLILLM